jgi:phosphoglucosamine mutase
LITALAVLARVVESGRSLSDLRQTMTRFPQVLRNLRVHEKPPLESLPAVVAAMKTAEQTLGERGRVLVRYSGTEKLLRVMLEGETASQIEALADEIVAAAEKAISA